MTITQYTDHCHFPGGVVTIGRALDRHAYAYQDGSLSLYNYAAGVLRREIRCRSYRRAVRLLRMHLKGYNV